MPTIGNQDFQNGSIRACSLYIHVPFCTVKCGYCHFYVVPYKAEHEKAFLQGIKQEWHMQKPLLAGFTIVSIYVGGGTPSLLSPESLSHILRLFQADKEDTFTIAQDCEITLEANPESVSVEKIRAYQALGINRLSIGVQSLDDDQLVLLDRRHLATRAIRAIEESHAAGITNLSIDLMYDIPGQSLKSWQRTVNRAVDLPICHLSLYNLTIEPHTSFFKKRRELQPLLPNPDESVSMLEYAIKHCEQAGLQRYEISAFARDSCYSRHNTGYWTGRPFLGLGPSAFSYFEGKRFRNTASLTKWISAVEEQKSPIDFEEKLQPDAAFRELLTIQLRLLEGVEWGVFLTRHGDAPLATCDAIDALCADQFLIRTQNTLRLTEKGRLFYDTVAETLI